MTEGSASRTDILIVVTRMSHEQGFMDPLRNGFGSHRLLNHPRAEVLHQVLVETKPRLLICELESLGLSVRRIAAMLAELKLDTHIIAAAPSMSTEAAIRAMSQGARDLVSPEDPLHLQLVVARELGILESWCRQNAARLAPYRNEEEGHATLDGLRIVRGDAVLARQLGLESEKSLESAPLLQFIDGDDHHPLRQMLARCLEGEGTIKPLPIRTIMPSGQRGRLLMSVKASDQDGRTSLSLVVRADMMGSAGTAAPTPARPLNPAVTRRIENALKHNHLALVMQPISELVGQPNHSPGSKLDIYVMLRDPDGELPASRFIHEARASGLIRPVDRWVIHNACLLLHRNFSKRGPITLFLRLSRQTLHDPMLLVTLKREIEQYRISPESLAFELFESDIANPDRDELRILHEMKTMGFLLSISHFAPTADPASLPRQVPFDFLKLEPKLAEKVPHSDNTRQRVQEIVRQANAAGKGVISTHVQNAAAMATLWSLGVHYVQGNYLQEPEIAV